jgi:Tfp pilus assembly protein PilV
MRAEQPVRRGSALIEALLSLVLLGTVGTSLLSVLVQTRQTMQSAQRTEAAIDSADAELERMVLYDRDALLDRLGWTTDRGLALHVEETASALFDVTIAREPGFPALLTTTLYRPDSADAR